MHRSAPKNQETKLRIDLKNKSDIQPKGLFVSCIWSRASGADYYNPRKHAKSASVDPEEHVSTCVCECKYILSSISKFAGTDHHCGL